MFNLKWKFTQMCLHRLLIKILIVLIFENNKFTSRTSADPTDFLRHEHLQIRHLHIDFCQKDSVEVGRHYILISEYGRWVQTKLFMTL